MRGVRAAFAEPHSGDVMTPTNVVGFTRSNALNRSTLNSRLSVCSRFADSGSFDGGRGDRKTVGNRRSICVKLGPLPSFRVIPAGRSFATRSWLVSVPLRIKRA